jgi:beta-N-acetylhexosaminidase
VSRVERLAAACLSPSFPGHEVPDWVLRRLEGGLGGTTLFAYNVRDPEQLAGLTARLRGVGEIVVSIDEEGGDVTRLEAASGSSYPGNYALGLVDDPDLTREVAAAMAAELAAAGVNLNLAPVADVNTNPSNPVIGVRSFGAEPQLVARHVAAFVEGTQRQGVAACVKHFPGHGDTSVDSHLDLPVVEGELETALVPFRAAIAAGVRAVMAGHLLVPALDEAPATLSPRLLAGLLRDELGFEGLVVTDALEMRAVAGTVGVPEAAVRALAAGADLLCLGHDLHEDAVDEVLDALVAAVGEGRLTLERLEGAAARVAETARWASSPTASGTRGRDAGAEAARRALRVHGEVSLSGPPLVLELAPPPNIAAGEHEHGLAALWPGAAGVRVRGPVADPGELLADHPDRDVVVVLRDAGRHEWQAALARDLVALRPDAVFVETGLPGGFAATVETAGAGRVNLEAACASLVAVERDLRPDPRPA